MSRFDDFNDDDFTLSNEMLTLLAEKEAEGLTSEDLLQKSQLASERVDVSRVLGLLRKNGDVAATLNPENVRVFVITDQGMDAINGKIELKKTTLSDVAPGLTKGRQKKGDVPVVQPTLTLVSAKRYSGLQCMLSSDGQFVLEVPGRKGTPGSRLELNDEQTKYLLLYLAKLFPKMVKLHAKKSDEE